MPIVDKVRIYHPDYPGTAVVSAADYTSTYQGQGWLTGSDPIETNYDDAVSTLETLTGVDFEGLLSDRDRPTVQFFSQAVDLPTVGANSTSAVVVALTAGTLPTTGHVVLYTSGLGDQGLVVQSVVQSAVDQLTVRVSNVTGVGIDAASQTLNFVALK